MGRKERKKEIIATLGDFQRKKQEAANHIRRAVNEANAMLEQETGQQITSVYVGIEGYYAHGSKPRHHCMNVELDTTI